MQPAFPKKYRLHAEAQKCPSKCRPMKHLPKAPAETRNFHAQ